MKIYYKYLPIERINYLENELLRASQPADLNDPFECRPQKPDVEEYKILIQAVSSVIQSQNGKNDKFKELIDQIIKNADDEEGLLNQTYIEANTKVNEDIGIFSLSKKWNNSLMWAHYTNSHKGLCIGYDSEHDFFQNHNKIENSKPKFINDVIYSEERVKIPLIEDKKPGLKPYFTKSVDWKYEEEVRMIFPLDEYYDKININGDYECHLFKIPHSAIKEIVIGAKTSLKHKETIQEFCSLKNINCYESKISDLKFDMERELINNNKI